MAKSHIKMTVNGKAVEELVEPRAFDLARASARVSITPAILVR